MIKEIDLAYIAGLFDGEGWVGIAHPTAKNGKKYNRLQVTITQQRREVLDWIASLLQYGKVYTAGHSPGGQMHKYVVTYRQAETFLATITPYTKIKTNEIMAALRVAYPTI